MVNHNIRSPLAVPIALKPKQNGLIKGVIPGLVVMGWDSHSEGCGFESQLRVLDGHFWRKFVVKFFKFSSEIEMCEHTLQMPSQSVWPQPSANFWQPAQTFRKSWTGAGVTQNRCQKSGQRYTPENLVSHATLTLFNCLTRQKETICAKFAGDGIKVHPVLIHCQDRLWGNQTGSSRSAFSMSFQHTK